MNTASAGEAQRAWLAIYDERANGYREQLDGCQQAFSVDAVHDVRVALRRLLALLEMLQQLHMTGRQRKLRRRLKRQLAGFSELRDVQVMLAALPADRQLPADNILARRLHEREQELLAEAQDKLQRFPAGKVLHRLDKLRVGLLQLPASRFSVARCRRTVDKAFAVVSARHAAADIGKPTTIHRERIAFKRFRYSVEILHAVSPLPDKALKALRAYQTLLGDIQDAHVLLAALDVAVTLPGGEGLTALLRHQCRHQNALLTRYQRQAGSLVGLWTPV
jgi:CHAD domain-containing protein